MIVAEVDRLQERIRREERAAGIRADRPLSAAGIRRRRRQVVGLALLVFFGLVVTTLRASFFGAADGSVIDPDLLRAAMITFTGGFIAYVVEKELHLRRLDGLAGEERAVWVAIADRLLARAVLVDAESWMHGSLLLDDAVARVADRAVALTGAARVRISLLDADGEPHVAVIRDAAGTSARSVPGVASLTTRVVRRGERLALSPSGNPCRSGAVAAVAVPSELVDAFAARAAVALENAARYEEALLRIEYAGVARRED